MSIMFLGASIPAANWSTGSVLATAALTGIVAGGSVGAVTGAYFPRLRIKASVASLDQ